MKRHRTAGSSDIKEASKLRTLYYAAIITVLFGLTPVVSFSRQANPAPPQNSNLQVIDMTAKKYVFNPSPIHVKKGTRVQLRITAIDHNHGFKINLYPDGRDAKGAPGLLFDKPQDCWRLPKGQVTTIEFVAETPGSYPFKCCVFCGFGHMGMKGELIVDP
jgi:cytochrome c oxidase subunit II